MNIPQLVTAFGTEGKIEAHRICAHGEKAGFAKQATAPADKLIGVLTSVEKESGEHADVIRTGLATVVYGGTVARGDYLTTDGTGRAVKASEGQAFIGIAETDGVADDLGAMLVTHGIAA